MARFPSSSYGVSWPHRPDVRQRAGPAHSARLWASASSAAGSALGASPSVSAGGDPSPVSVVSSPALAVAAAEDDVLVASLIDSDVAAFGTTGAVGGAIARYESSAAIIRSRTFSALVKLPASRSPRGCDWLLYSEIACSRTGTQRLIRSTFSSA